MEWMLMPLRRYADFEGRSRRMEYWMFTLGILIVYAILGTLLVAGGFFVEGDQGMSIVGIAAGILLVLFALGVFIPGIAVTVRRFHDQDKSGWFFLLTFIPYVGGLIIFVFMCLDGTRGSNRYGPDPKAPEQEHEEIFA
jgi:uncharacterized membrane protein YhaH (DUF805 family)